jgi:uncharacterized Ntn-hydrolase superfamily protein
MTWSLIAHDPASGGFGIAVATCAFAVGAACPHWRAGVGAVSTQSITNRYLGPAMLDAMARGLTPRLALESVLAGDEGRHLRQVHAVDAQGRAAAWTGRHCVEWCGDEAGPGVSLAGNMLAGPEVLPATRAAYAAAAALPMPERLMVGMQAGEAAGGDRRGRQSAALVFGTTEDFADCDLRVDDHADPLGELARLLGIWRASVAPRIAARPRRADPAGDTDIDAMEARWAAAGSALRFRR